MHKKSIDTYIHAYIHAYIGRCVCVCEYVAALAFLIGFWGLLNSTLAKTLWPKGLQQFGKLGTPNPKRPNPKG